MRYSAPFGLTVGGDYTYYGEKRNQSLFQKSAYLLGELNKQDINRWHIYLDQQHQLGNGNSVMALNIREPMTVVHKRLVILRDSQARHQRIWPMPT